MQPITKKKNHVLQPLPQYHAGVDEVGRGCIAGPVVAAAVILPVDFDISVLADSKKLSASRRHQLAELITQHACFAIGSASVTEIDTHNILAASLIAMARAVTALNTFIDHVHIDGTHTPQLNLPMTTHIGGDNHIGAIAAASIIAKVYRDRLLCQYHRLYPQYYFDQHKGYGTAKHLQALAEHGPCRWHRRSFAPVKRLLNHTDC